MIGPLLHRHLFGVIVALAAFVASSAVSQAQDQASADELRQRLAELDHQIAAEKAALDQLEKTHQAEQTTHRERRSALAAKLLDARLKVESNARQNRALQTEMARLEHEAQQWESAAGAVRLATSSAAERLRVLLSEVPGQDDAREQLRVLLDSLAQPGGDATKATQNFIGLLDQAHQQAGSVHLVRTELHTATGQLEEVDLLRAGFVRFAYVTIADKRVGLALASPNAASGYRWSEGLDDDMATAVRDVVAAVGTGKPQVVMLPVDPTGRVEPQTLASRQTLAAQVQAGGPVMIPLGIVLLLALLLIAERLYVLYVLNPQGSAGAQRVISACRSGHADVGAVRTARGTVARVLASCLARRSKGQRAMEDSIQEQMLQEMPQLNRFLGGIAILAGVAPLLGLLGTVTGIIQTFGVIRAFGNANPALMAGGISEALITTAAGLIIAIPILIVHSLLRGRADTILADAERHAASLLTTLTHDVGTSSNASDQDAQNSSATANVGHAREGGGS